jgi:hypothetical protein
MIVLDVDASAVLLNKALRNSEPQARPMRFRGKKRLKYLINLRFVDPVSRVDNLDVQRKSRLGARCLNGYHAAVRHGVSGIQEQIQEHLLELLGIRQGFRKMPSIILDDGYRL